MARLLQAWQRRQVICVAHRCYQHSSAARIGGVNRKAAIEAVFQDC
jgi:hypothetical protein